MAQEDVTKEKLTDLSALLVELEKTMNSRKTAGDGVAETKARAAMAQVDAAIPTLEVKVKNCIRMLNDLSSK